MRLRDLQAEASLRAFRCCRSSNLRDASALDDQQRATCCVISLRGAGDIMQVIGFDMARDAAKKAKAREDSGGRCRRRVPQGFAVNLDAPKRHAAHPLSSNEAGVPAVSVV